MKVYNAIIIDDERNIREALSLLLKEYCPDIRVCGMAPSAGSGRELLEKYKIDIIFLDISMPGEDGFDFIQSIPHEKYQIIFVTAYGEYAMSALKANAVDYLMKPIDPFELREAVSKAIRQHEGRVIKADVRIISKSQGNQVKGQKGLHNETAAEIPVEDQFGHKMVRASDLMYLETDSHYTILHFSGLEKVVSTRAIGEFEKLLAGQGFFRIHRSVLLNLKYVRSYSSSEGNVAMLTDGTQLGISRRKSSEFKEALKQCINR